MSDHDHRPPPGIAGRCLPCPDCGGDGYDDLGACPRCGTHGYVIVTDDGGEQPPVPKE